MITDAIGFPPIDEEMTLAICLRCFLLPFGGSSVESDWSAYELVDVVSHMTAMGISIGTHQHFLFLIFGIIHNNAI